MARGILYSRALYTPPSPVILRPGASNTGTSGTLTPSGGISAETPGQLIENLDIAGAINVEANNVTIRNCRIDGGGVVTYGIRANFGATGLLIEDCEILGHDSAGVIGSNMTMRRCNIHEHQRDALKIEGNSTVEYCWIHHLGKASGSHADGNQTRGGSDIYFYRNYFDMPIGQSGYASNACAIIQAETANIDNVVLEENWLNGGNYTVYFQAEVSYGFALTNCKLLGNRFMRDYNFGVYTTEGNVSGLVVTGNVWDDTGAPMDIND